MTEEEQPQQPEAVEPAAEQQAALEALQVEGNTLATEILRRFVGPPPRPLQALNILPALNTAMLYPQIQSMVCRHFLVTGITPTDLEFETMQASVTRDLLAGLLHTLEQQELVRPTSPILVPGAPSPDVQQVAAEILRQRQGMNGGGRKLHD